MPTRWVTKIAPTAATMGRLCQQWHLRSTFMPLRRPRPRQLRQQRLFSNQPRGIIRVMAEAVPEAALEVAEAPGAVTNAETWAGKTTCEHSRPPSAFPDNANRLTRGQPFRQGQAITERRWPTQAPEACRRRSQVEPLLRRRDSRRGATTEAQSGCHDRLRRDWVQRNAD